MSKLSCRVVTLQLQGPHVSIYVTSLEIITLWSSAQSHVSSHCRSGFGRHPPGASAAFAQHGLVGGGGVGQAHRQGSCPEDAGREAVSLVSLCFLSTWGMRWSPKQEIKLAYWVPYWQTICPRHKERPPQGRPEGNRCSWGQGLFLFFQAGLKSASSIYMNPCTLSPHRQGDPVTSPTPLGSARH